MVDIRLNKSIDPDKFARIYAKQRYVQIPDLLEPQSADAPNRSSVPCHGGWWCRMTIWKTWC